MIIFSLVFVHLIVAPICAVPLAPALYVFGDSLLDSGNNDFLPTLAKANYFPYGADFPKGSTGRFTNGRTVADFIGISSLISIQYYYKKFIFSIHKKIIIRVTFIIVIVIIKINKFIHRTLRLDNVQITYFSVNILYPSYDKCYLRRKKTSK